MYESFKQVLLLFITRRNAEKIKTLIACCFYYSGVAWLMSHRRKRGGYIVMYHSVGGEDVFWDNVISKEAFAAQIEWLKKHRKVVRVSDFVDRIDQNNPIPDDWIALTFDDGYQDNYVNALPVLESENAVASFYVTWNILTGQQDFFYDRIHVSLLQTEKDSIEVDLEGSIFKGPTVSKEQKLHCIQEIVLKIRNMSEAKRATCVTRVEAECQSSAATMRNAYLDEHTLKDFSRSPVVQVGSHTLSHPDLAKCTDPWLKNELFMSRENLSRVVGYTVEGLAYPFGKSSNYNHAVLRGSRETGYGYGLTTTYGVVQRDSDPFQLPRVGARESLTRLKVNLMGVSV